jgi:hypothetical protein
VPYTSTSRNNYTAEQLTQNARARQNLFDRADARERESFANLRNRSTYNRQVEAARQRNANARARVGRLRGASEGGDFLETVSKIREQGAEAYNRAIRRGKNSRAAARAAEAATAGLKNLVDARGDILRDQAYRDRTAADVNIAGQRIGLDAELGRRRLGLEERGLGADQEYRNAKLDLEAQMYNAESASEANKYFRDEYIPLWSTIPDGEGGFINDPQLQARITDLTAGITDTRVARDVASMERAITVINQQLGEAGLQVNDITELFDLDAGGGLSFDAGEWNDIANTPGFGFSDWLADLLPGGASGDVLTGTKNGRTYRIAAGDLQRIGLTPAVIKRLFGKESRRNR